MSRLLQTLVVVVLAVSLAPAPARAGASRDRRVAVWKQRGQVALNTSPVWSAMIVGGIRSPSPTVGGRMLGVAIGGLTGVGVAYGVDRLQQRLRATRPAHPRERGAGRSRSARGR